jgi:AraC family transcriptional activator of tynA and feaB
LDLNFGPAVLRERDGYSCWHEVICRLYAGAEPRLNDEEATFSAEFSRRILGPVALSDIRCAPLRYDRRREDIRRDPNDDFLMTLMLAGRARLEQGGRSTLQGPGDLVLYDAAREFTYDFDEPYRILLLRIPRRTLLSRLQDAERLTAVSVSDSSSVCSLASNLIRSSNSLMMPPHAGPSVKVGAALIDLLSAAFEIEAAGRSDLCDRQAALLQRAKEYLRANLSDLSLDVDTIAHRLNTSPSTLSRAFASQRVTVMRWLWGQRLEASRTALQEGRVTRVLDLALGCGFANGSHFSRMFRRTYGVCPHSLLRAPADDAGSQAARGGDRDDELSDLDRFRQCS